MSNDATLTQREAASRDLWVRNQIAFLDGRSLPVAAHWAQPQSTQEVAEVVRASVAAGRKIVPLGAGSGVCGGVSAAGDELVLDLKRLTTVDVRADLGVARFGAGVMGRHAEEACNRHDCTIGHFPSSIACSTVGGWVAARGAGQLSSRYGKMEDICVGATAVLADGTIHSVTRGDPLLYEWLGNEGSLAVLTEVTLRIRPRRQGWTFACFLAPDLSMALHAAKQIVRQRPVPSLLRVYDPIDSRIALSHSKGRLAKQLPFMLAAPKLIRYGGDLLLRKCLIVVGWEGAGETWDRTCTATKAIGAALKLKDLGSRPGELWLARRHDVSFKQISILRSQHFADTFEVGCPWTRTESVYHAVREAISAEAVSMAHFSHAYTDGSAIYFSIAGRLDAYDRTWQRALRAASDAGATISHHHGVGRLKAPLMCRELGGTLRVLVEAKREHDPLGLLNPGCLGLPCEITEAPPHETFEGIDRGNGLWCGEVSSTVGGVERSLRKFGWTLGWSTSGKQTVRAILANDMCNVQSTRLGSAIDRVVALSGHLDDSTPFATRVTPRSATGPDLRRRILSGPHHVKSVTFRLARWPQRWLHLHGTFDEPIAVVRRLLTGPHEPWAAMVSGDRVDLWFAFDTPACKLLAEKVPWGAERDHEAPDETERGRGLAPLGWRPWDQLHDGVIVGLGVAGGWQVEVAQ